MFSFEKLKSSYKKAYPFRLAAPSYIYPADWCTNAEMIGPYVDEIELLFLESHSESCFPSPEEIRELSVLARAYSLTYNVHLPSDISLSDPIGSGRREAVETLSRVIALTSPLMPSTWTLHLPFDRVESTPGLIEEWRACNREGLLKLLKISGISTRSLSIETLFYPFRWIGDVVRALDLSICLDTGHSMIRGVDVVTLYAEYADIISIMHLHGVCGHSVSEQGVCCHGASDPEGYTLMDHVSLDRLSPERGEKILTLLRQFKGIVSVEVFSFNKLSTSLEWLSDQWKAERNCGRRE
ncbi:MAG: cobamide remodeling phosphodiesterase CbiR [Pseudomonadota bacterium]